MAKIEDLVEKSWEAQRRVESVGKRVGKGRYGRVLKMATKPESEEYHTSLKIVAIGALVIGAIGFAIYQLMNLLYGVIGK